MFIRRSFNLNPVHTPMGLNIKLNFGDCYPMQASTDNHSKITFNTVLHTGDLVPISIRISEEMHPLIPNAYNLAFGPIGHDDQIDDNIKLRHQNHSKLFSTIISAGITFLGNNKEKFLGIDGSDNAKAYMYYRCIQNNYDYLNQYLNIYGVKYYVRILREPNENNGSFLDSEDVVATSNLIHKEPFLKSYITISFST